MKESMTTTTPPPVTNKRGRKPGKKSSDKVDIRAKLGLCSTSSLTRCVYMIRLFFFSPVTIREEPTKRAGVSSQEKAALPVSRRVGDGPGESGHISAIRIRQSNLFVLRLTAQVN